MNILNPSFLNEKLIYATLTKSKIIEILQYCNIDTSSYKIEMKKNDLYKILNSEILDYKDVYEDVFGNKDDYIEIISNINVSNSNSTKKYKIKDNAIQLKSKKFVDINLFYL